MNLAFDNDSYKCGCQCAQYTSPSGDAWLLRDVRTATFTPLPLSAHAPGSETLPSYVHGRCSHCPCSLPQHAAAGSNPPMWPRSLRSNSSGQTFNIPADVTCAQRDYGKCGVQFSEPVSLARGPATATASHCRCRCCRLLRLRSLRLCH